MNYELFSFVMVGFMVLLLVTTRPWISWPFSLRSLFWSGAFSYIMLLAMPRVFILPGVDTLIQIAFWVVITMLFAWILAYHNI